MKINELNNLERKQYYNDSDIFNTRPPKTPERFKFKKYLPITSLKTHNYNTISTDNVPIEKYKHEKYYNNKKDHINDYFWVKKPASFFLNHYKKYRKTEDLKKYSRKIQYDNSYQYNFDENNNNYNNIKFHGKKGSIVLGNEPSNFSSEYNSMHDYANRVMLKKTINKEEIKSDKLNKSVDIPQKFMALKRNNYHRKHAIKELYLKNSIDLDMSKSMANIFNKKRNNVISNNLMFYKSNIFFDKEKEKSSEELDKIANEFKTQKQKEKLELQHEKLVRPKIKRRKTNFLYEDMTKINPNDKEEYKKFQRNGAFPLEYANYKPQKEIIIKSLDNEYNARNKRLYNGLSEMERNTDKFVVLDISKNDKFDPREIKNLFGKNGIHMFGEQTFNSYIENGKKGKFVFNIRKDVNDKDYNTKLKKIQSYLMKKQGIVFDIDNRKANYKKKVSKDIRPTFIGFKDFKSNRLNNLNNMNDINEYQEQKIIKTTKVKIVKYH